MKKEKFLLHPIFLVMAAIVIYFGNAFLFLSYLLAVILHELAHLKVRNHSKYFVAIMDQYMPCWRETRKLLNDLKLDYYEETVGDV